MNRVTPLVLLSVASSAVFFWRASGVSRIPDNRHIILIVSQIASIYVSMYLTGRREQLTNESTQTHYFSKIR